MALLDRFATELAAGGGRVADVGCGPGRITAYLAASGVDAFGVDLSPGMIEHATAAHPELSFEVGTMLDLAIEDGTLAGLLAWYSMIHTPSEQLPAVLREFKRVLAPGGLLLLGFHAGSGSVHLESAYGHDVDLSIQLIDTGELASLLVVNGFFVDAALNREPVGRERRPQGFLLAHSH